MMIISPPLDDVESLDTSAMDPAFGAPDPDGDGVQLGVPNGVMDVVRLAVHVSVGERVPLDVEVPVDVGVSVIVPLMVPDAVRVMVRENDRDATIDREAESVADELPVGLIVVTPDADPSRDCDDNGTNV
jgi:hypothetical protein